MATIIPFPGRRRPSQYMPRPRLPVVLTPDWQEQHLPLIDAAMDLLAADDAEFTRRCKLMADEDGRTLLEELSARLEQLGSHVGDIVEALAMTAQRIRSTMATLPA